MMAFSAIVGSTAFSINLRVRELVVKELSHGRSSMKAS